jgi:predicted transcriptional regulator
MPAGGRRRRFEARVSGIEEHWRAALGRVRAGSAVELLLGALPGVPIVSVSGAAELIGRSFQAANEAMRRLETAGVVRQVTVGRRNRAYEARAIIDAFTALERQLASPAGNTRAAPPRRPTPARRANG